MGELQIEEPQILEPLEKRERKLVIEWPEKQKLLEDRDKYLNDHFEKNREKMREYFPKYSEVKIDQLSRLYGNTLFMLQEMQRLSPIPLEVPIEVTDFRDTEVSDFFVTEWMADDGRDSQLVLVKMKINLSRIDVEIDEQANELNTLLEISEKIEMGLSEEEAKKEVTMEIDKNIADLDILMMEFAVHEFAHLIYAQGRFNRPTNRRVAGLNNAMSFFRREKYLSPDVRWENYLSLELETRARLWEVEFLRHYFPDSKFLDKVQEELRIGREARVKKSNRVISRV